MPRMEVWKRWFEAVGVVGVGSVPDAKIVERYAISVLIVERDLARTHLGLWFKQGEVV